MSETGFEMMKNKKIILFANTDWYLYNFRQSLAERLRDNGFEVVLVSPPGGYGDKLRELGFRWIPFQLSTQSINPLREVVVLWQLFQLYKSERPDLVHHFTIKCVLYGSFVAQILGGIRILNSITGLGHIFTDTGLKAKLICPFVRLLYRFVLSNNNVRVIFQNAEDRSVFVKDHLVDESITRLIRGSGVNCEVFHPVDDIYKRKDAPVRVLFASRLLKEKGVMELLEAARIIKAKNINVEFVLAGDLYPGNPSSLTEEEIEDIEKEGIVTYLGHVENMSALIGSCDVVVLPSYREGTPRILIEAAAMAKPIVATRIAGCLGLVNDWVNGLLVPVKDSAALARAIEYIAEHKDVREKFGAVGRAIVLSEFEENIVLDRTFDVVRELSPT